MPFYSPLRYPGGKRRLAPAIMRLLEANGLSEVHYAEPYAGGAAIALALLFEGYASTVSINDLSRPIFAFWNSALNDTDQLCRRVDATRVDMAEWYRQRAVYDCREFADLNDLGFATLFLNRTNRSGIIGGGVIGGKQQEGEWSLDARFNKKEIVKRIQRIAKYRGQIRLHQLEALTFTSRFVAKLGRSAFVFYDPPYIEKGDNLYLNTYTVPDHLRLGADIMRLKQPWVVTYDHAAVSYNIYPDHRQITFDLSYSAQNRCLGKEVMFLSNSLALPTGWTRSSQFCLTPKRSEYPLYGMMGNLPPYQTPVTIRSHR